MFKKKRNYYEALTVLLQETNKHTKEKLSNTEQTTHYLKKNLI